MTAPRTQSRPSCCAAQFSWLFYLPLALFCPLRIYALHRGVNTVYQARALRWRRRVEVMGVRQWRHGAWKVRLRVPPVQASTRRSMYENSPPPSLSFSRAHTHSHPQTKLCFLPRVTLRAVLHPQRVGAQAVVAGGAGDEHALTPPRAPRPKLRQEVRRRPPPPPPPPPTHTHTGLFAIMVSYGFNTVRCLHIAWCTWPAWQQGAGRHVGAACWGAAKAAGAVH